MSVIRQKIRDRLNALEAAMIDQKHQGNPEDHQAVLDLIDSITKFWSVLDDGDRDFLNAARMVVSQKSNWT
jgi:hypothetical protein